MNIGIVFAMDEELKAFEKYFESLNQTKLNNLVVYDVKHKNNHLYFIRCGVGKVNAAYATTKLIEHVQLDCLFNSGVAGGLQAVHGGLVLGKHIVHHDFDVTAFSEYVRGQVPGLPLRFKADESLLNHAMRILKDRPYTVGTIASGDQFIVAQDPLRPIINVYNDIVAIEMESAAIAQVATLENIPFLIVRAISDIIGEDAQSDNFSSFLKHASEVSAELLFKMVDTPWR